MPAMTLLEDAKRICDQYGATLPKKWAGQKQVKHAWHRPQIYFLMTWDKYLGRVVEIGTRKPKNERAERLRLMHPSEHFFARTKAYAAWTKADAARTKADAAWTKADADEIHAAHSAECPGCKWDGEKLPQFD